MFLDYKQPWTYLNPLVLFLFLQNIVFSALLSAQCPSAVSSYPFKEDFESSDGGWTAGGNFSDWEWGEPSKPIIRQANSGNRCWITGGLSKTRYNNNENSFLVSPCFDLSGLAVPYLSFYFFCETERNFDGAAMEYSTDNGLSWSQLGSYFDYLDCPSGNWFNSSNIRYGAGEGWSGNSLNAPNSGCGAGGMNGNWNLATQGLAFLKGERQVRFRFLFGAGSFCNDYDGFAIDDFMVSEAPQANPGFSYACLQNKNVAFSADPVPCGATCAWNFGDPASGAQNISTFLNPTHGFSGPGSYTISFTETHNGRTSLPYLMTIHIFTTAITSTAPIACQGDATGALALAVSGPSIPYTIVWDNNPALSGTTLTNASAGNHQVTIVAANACGTSASLNLPEPPLFSIELKGQGPICLTKGSIDAGTAGGTAPYIYIWNPAVSNSNVANGLEAGSYSVTAQDANGCKASGSIALTRSLYQPTITLGNDTTICKGDKIELTPGPDNSFTTKKWQDNSLAPSYMVDKEGRYTATVTDANGCTATASVYVYVKCDPIFFPTAIRPDAFAVNGTFGPLPMANLGGVREYQLLVYDRFGQLVFASKDPFKKWDGSFNGNPLRGTFVWLATYRLGNKKSETQKGTVSLF